MLKSDIENTVDVIIADNQFLIIEALKTILIGQYSIIDIVDCKNDLIHTLKSRTPRLLIVDYSLLDFEGFEDLNAIKKMLPSLTILILTSNITRNEITEFNKLDINNILNKNADKEEFFAGIEAALKGKKYYSSSILDMILETKDRSGTTDESFHLTSSEIEIVRLIAQGLTTKDIARQKFLSSHTIMTHRKNILRKLGVSNASELIMYAIRNGIIDTIEYHI